MAGYAGFASNGGCHGGADAHCLHDGSQRQDVALAPDEFGNGTLLYWTERKVGPIWSSGYGPG